MKEKTFGKESKTPLPNFKSVNNVESLLIDQIENTENQKLSET